MVLQCLSRYCVFLTFWNSLTATITWRYSLLQGNSLSFHFQPLIATPSPTRQTSVSRAAWKGSPVLWDSCSHRRGGLWEESDDFSVALGSELCASPWKMTSEMRLWCERNKQLALQGTQGNIGKGWIREFDTLCFFRFLGTVLLLLMMTAFFFFKLSFLFLAFWRLQLM